MHDGELHYPVTNQSVASETALRKLLWLQCMQTKISGKHIIFAQQSGQVQTVVRLDKQGDFRSSRLASINFDVIFDFKLNYSVFSASIVLILASLRVGYSLGPQVAAPRASAMFLLVVPLSADFVPLG